MSIASNTDLSSQPEYVFQKWIKAKTYCPLLWTSYKAIKVIRFVIGSEAIAFSEASDMAYVIKHDFRLMTNSYTPPSMTEDSLSLIDLLTKASSNTGKRLEIHLQSAQHFS